MAFAGTNLITHGLSGEELDNRWHRLGPGGQAALFKQKATSNDQPKTEAVVGMKLGFLVEKCEFLTAQRVITTICTF